MAAAITNEKISRIFKGYNNVLISYLTAHLKSREEAQEVAQEAYLRLLNMNNANEIADLESYLFKIAKNIARDRLRREGVKLKVYNSAKITMAAQDEPSAQTVTGPEAETAGRQTLVLLHAAINELPPKCRMSFVLYKLQGKSYRDIASRMNLTESMIRKYVLRALDYCQRRLDQELN